MPPFGELLRNRRRPRPGFALLDVIIGGVILGIGLAVLTSLATRALRAQSDGEMRLTASWLADEMMNSVLVEGPDQFSRKHDTVGAFTEPFALFRYEVSINDRGVGVPYAVTTTISWPSGRTYREVEVSALIAKRSRHDDDLEPSREPFEPLDRLERWDLKLNPPEEDAASLP